MRPLLAIAVLLGLATLTYTLTRRYLAGQFRVPVMELETDGDTSRATCTGKRRCLVVYVAPWCPACHAQETFIQSVYRALEGKSDTGIKVVVGADERNNLLEMAQSLGVPVFFDPDKRFKHSAGIRGIPQWLVGEPDGTVASAFTTIEGADGSDVPGAIATLERMLSKET